MDVFKKGVDMNPKDFDIAKDWILENCKPSVIRRLTISNYMAIIEIEIIGIEHELESAYSNDDILRLRNELKLRNEELENYKQMMK